MCAGFEIEQVVDAHGFWGNRTLTSGLVQSTEIQVILSTTEHASRPRS